MATIAIELGKVSSKNTREVYLLVRQGKSTQKRRAELSPPQKQELSKSSKMSLRTIWRLLNKPP